jgi:hypothetical protein
VSGLPVKTGVHAPANPDVAELEQRNRETCSHPVARLVFSERLEHQRGEVGVLRNVQRAQCAACGKTVPSEVVWRKTMMGDRA